MITPRVVSTWEPTGISVVPVELDELRRARLPDEDAAAHGLRSDDDAGLGRLDDVRLALREVVHRDVARSDGVDVDDVRHVLVGRCVSAAVGPALTRIEHAVPVRVAALELRDEVVAFGVRRSGIGSDRNARQGLVAGVREHGLDVDPGAGRTRLRARLGELDRSRLLPLGCTARGARHREHGGARRQGDGQSGA